MGNPNKLQTKSRIHQITGKLADSLRWLTKPARSLPEHLIHQSVLLAWTLPLIIFLALASIILIPHRIPQRSSNIVLILTLVFVFIIAFIVNRIGRYHLGAVLTILGAVIAPWSSLFLDPAVLQEGNCAPLDFIAASVLLSSILLPPVFTALVAGIQLAAVIHLLSVIPFTVNTDRAHLLTFLLFISATSILASFISQRYQKQIAHQKSLLVESEAKLREQSIRDYLTGLYNRRYLDETLDREIRRAERAVFPVGVIMLDIDHFKIFNGQFGHAAGDLVLQEIASLLKSKIRYADIVCRYGGEEFVVVMPEASLQITIRRAEDLRKEVKQLEVQFDNQSLGKLTISSGVAVYPDHGSTAEAVMKSADSALFIAKNSGRDKVVVASAKEIVSI